MAARRFEFEEGSSSKFWAVERNARKVTVTFGRIGSTGQAKTKSFPTDAKAAQEEEKLIAEKIKKGYSEVDEEEAEEDEDDGEPTPPPPGFSKPTTWDAIAKAWSAGGKTSGAKKRASRAKVRASDVKSVVKALGIRRLPPSYLVYLERFNRFGELEQRYQREDFTHFLNIWTPDVLADQRAHFRELLDMFFNDVTAEAKKRINAARNLIPFGSDTSRTDICWDPARTTPDGEMAICFYDHDDVRSRNAGRDLKEIVKYYRPHYR